MRIAVLALAAAVSVLGAAGCGGDERPGGSLDDVLRYLPEDAPQVIVVSTDLDGDQWQAFDARLGKGELSPDSGADDGDPLNTDPPPPGSIEGVLRQTLAEGEISYDDDVKPLLGGDLVLGVVGEPLTSPEALNFDGLVLALDTGDADAARSLLAQLDFHEQGEESGAELFGEAGPAGGDAQRNSDPFVALVDDVVVFAIGSEDPDAGGGAIREALATAASDHRLTEERFDAAMPESSEEALVRAYISPEGLLEVPDLAPLGGLPWVGALESIGGAASFTREELRLEGVIRTDDTKISDEDLPLPAGAPTPELVRREGEIAGASANQSQTTVFLLDAVRAAFPDSRFARDVARLERELEIEFERDFLRRFDGPSASSLPLNDEFAARSEVDDAERMAGVLRELAPDIGRLVQDLQALQGRGLIPLFLFAPDAPIAPGVLGESRIEVTRIAGERDLYRISNLIPPGQAPVTPLPPEIVFGLIDGEFVVASDLRRAREVASAPSEPAPGGLEGASVAAGDLGPLRGRIERLIGFDPGPLGELTASLRASTSELRGAAAIALP